MVQEDFANALNETRTKVERTSNTGSVEKVLVCKGRECRGRGDDGVDKIFNSFDIHVGGVVVVVAVLVVNEERRMKNEESGRGACDVNETKKK